MGTQKWRPGDRNLYLCMLSVHGRIRAQEPELGIDPDTGGQITYVLDLARTLAESPLVERVDLITRQIVDPALPSIYRTEREEIVPKAQIVRLPFGPRKYLRKESLWKYLDTLVDRCWNYLRAQERLPDFLHSHYADAGYVAVQLSQLLGIPLLHTGHSLGRIKKERLLAAGRRPPSIEREFQLEQRIAAEEQILQQATLVIASTNQEATEQYGRYDAHPPVMVIPPGVDLTRFGPPSTSTISEPAAVQKFLRHPKRPPILAIARPDERKNLLQLLDSFAQDPWLRAHANLVLVLGQRDSLGALPRAAQRVLTRLLFAIDDHDLYGSVAIPKHHEADDIPTYYRWAARLSGVFINPALTEPFGLTLLEAAASGLPIVATADGGPTDIIANCHNGRLVDPLDPSDIQGALREALQDRSLWLKRARSGLRGVQRHYGWKNHVDTYLHRLSKIRQRYRKRERRLAVLRQPVPGSSDWLGGRELLISDIDNTLIGDADALARLGDWLLENRHQVAFGIATGRTLKGALEVLRAANAPTPELFITDVGSEIYFGKDHTPDAAWDRHIRHLWQRDSIVSTLRGIQGLRPQENSAQRACKVSYYVNPEHPDSVRHAEQALQEKNLRAQMIFSHGRFLDVLPVQASKGHALHFLAYRWGKSMQSFLVAGDSGNDAEMLRGDTLAVIVGNHSPELEELRDHPNCYFAHGAYAAGILEGIAHYGFPIKEQE